MIYLLFQIVFASALTLFVKWAQVRGREDIITIGAINYIVAAIAILPVVLRPNQTPISTGAVWTGGSTGTIYFIAFFFAIYSIKKVGASSATVVSVLSILLPIGFAAVVWNQRPNWIQWIGIALALLALALIGVRTDRVQTEYKTAPAPWVVPTVLLLFFLLCGCSRLSQEAFGHLSQPAFRPTFIFAAFITAAIPSLVMLIYRQLKPQPMEIAMGTMMGMSNVFQTHYILRALEHFEGFIVFPVSAAGSIVFTTLVATRLLGEQLNRRTYLGIAIAVVALFLLYWVPT